MFKYTIYCVLFVVCVVEAVPPTRPTVKPPAANDLDLLKDILKVGFDNVHRLVLNINDSTLYFTCDKMTPRGPTRVLGYLETNTQKFGFVEGIRNVTCISVDQSYNNVYAGGPDGLYRVNSLKAPERLPVQDDIQSMYFKDVLYYTNSRKQAYTYHGGRINPVLELEFVFVENIILDDDHNILFTQGKDLFRVKLGTSEIHSVVRNITKDVDHKPTDVDHKPTDVDHKPTDVDHKPLAKNYTLMTFDEKVKRLRKVSEDLTEGLNLLPRIISYLNALG